MRFPRHSSPLAVAAGILTLLLFGPQAQAGKAILQPIPSRSISGSVVARHAAQAVSRRHVIPSAGSMRVDGSAVSCSTGVLQDASSILNFTVPPDDAYYTLFRVDDCPTCATADTAIITRVHMLLELRSVCQMPVDVYMVGVQGVDSCLAPNTADVLYPSQSFFLPPATRQHDTTEVVFTLPFPATLVERAFLVINFADTLPCVSGGANGDSIAGVVFAQDTCYTCRSFNDWTGGDELDDLCNPAIPVGNPVIWADVDDCYPLFDLVAPAAVADLAPDSTGIDAIRLSWSAPGDDGNVGRASSYDLRVSPSPINNANFGSAQQLFGLPVPAAAGTQQKYLATGLEEYTTYYFALKSRDNALNLSPLSNVLNVTTEIGFPGIIQGFTVADTTSSSATLQWLATGDDGNVGRPQSYMIAASLNPLTPNTFKDFLRDSLVPTVDAGNPETITITGLQAATTYHFGIRARDDSGNLSPLATTIGVTSGGTDVLSGRTAPAIVALDSPANTKVDLAWKGMATADQKIRIYDMTGRLIRTMPLSASAQGVQPWDGKDDDGKDAPAGVYVARFQSGSGAAKAKVVLLR